MPADIQALVRGIGDGERNALSRGITLIESSRTDDRQDALQLLKACRDGSRRTLRIGISGVPGAGKSTFIEALGLYLVERGERVAVLAVDPSSQTTQGSILGDKTRMPKLSVDRRAFVRPSPTKGALGGVTERTTETIALCEAAGFNIILVETVGVGQSETLVSTLVDYTLLLMLARTGDELQGIKRGVLEMASVVAVNKAEGDNFLAAKQAQKELQMALQLMRGEKVPVLTCSALLVDGIDSVWSALRCKYENDFASGTFDETRQRQRREAFTASFQYEILRRLRISSSLTVQKSMLLDAIERGELSAFQAATILVDRVLGEGDVLEEKLQQEKSKEV